MELQEEREKVLIPVRRQETTPAIKELPEELPEPSDVQAPEMPRRWYVF